MEGNLKKYSQKLYENIQHSYFVDWTENLKELANPRNVTKLANFAVLVSLLLFLLLCTISYLYMTCSRKGRLLRNFSSYLKFPIIGNLWVLVGGPQAASYAINNAIRKYGSRRGVFWIGHRPVVILVDAESVQKMLSSSKYLEKGQDYAHIHWILGQGLISSDVPTWREDRKLLSPYFKYQALVGFLPIFNKYSKTLVHILAKNASESNHDTNLHPFFCRANMDKISESTTGQPSFFQLDPESKLYANAQIALAIFRIRMIKPYLTIPPIWWFLGYSKQQKESKEELMEYVSERINARRHYLASKKGSLNPEKPVFVDALLELRTEQEILDHVITIFAAGFETTASGINYTLFLLATNPKCQAIVHEEIDQVLGFEERDVDLNDLTNMKYLEMCIKESFRIFPPVAAFNRNVNEDVVLDDKLTIPKGCDVFFFPYALHRDPKYFPDPEKFVPERWVPEACAQRHFYSYLPFSLGPRNCLGQKYTIFQMKTALAHILRKFRVTTTQKKEDLEIVYGVVLETVPKIKLSLAPRKKLK